MGKHKKQEESECGSESYIYNHYSGCIPGMLNVFDYHHWGIKHRRRKGWGKSRTHSTNNEIYEMQPGLESEGRPVQDGQDVLEDNMMMMTQTSSNISGGETKIINRIKTSLIHRQEKEYVDILERLDINEDVFIKLLKHPNRGFVNQIHVNRTSNRFTRSGSFPLPGSSRVHPSTNLEHKLQESWSFPKKENLVLTVKFPDFDSSKLQEDENGGTEESLNRKSRIYSHGLNRIMINGIRDIKKRIKLALGDRKKKIKKKDLSRKFHGTDLDRYCLLLQRSLRRREVEFEPRRLKLTNGESEIASKGRNPKFFKRVSSLSRLESLSSLMTDLYRESLYLENWNRVCEEGCEKVKAVAQSEFQEGERDCGADFKDLDGEDPQLSSISVLGICSSEEIGKKAETLISKDINSGEIHIYAPDSSFNSHYKSSNHDLEEIPTWKNQENFRNGVFFEFVKYVLEESGSPGDKHLGENRHSEDKTLNPKLHHELDGDYQILLDSIHESVIELNSRSSKYFPRTILSSSRRITSNSIPKGEHLLDEVWGRIRWNYAGLSANPDRSLDDVVACDLLKGGDGWMDLESEAELVILGVEDMIFEELLGEIVCF